MLTEKSQPFFNLSVTQSLTDHLMVARHYGIIVDMNLCVVMY